MLNSPFLFFDVFQNVYNGIDFTRTHIQYLIFNIFFIQRPEHAGKIPSVNVILGVQAVPPNHHRFLADGFADGNVDDPVSGTGVVRAKRVGQAENQVIQTVQFRKQQNVLFDGQLHNAIGIVGVVEIRLLRAAFHGISVNRPARGDVPDFGGPVLDHQFQQTDRAQKVGPDVF